MIAVPSSSEVSTNWPRPLCSRTRNARADSQRGAEGGAVAGKRAIQKGGSVAADAGLLKVKAQSGGHQGVDRGAVAPRMVRCRSRQIRQWTRCGKSMSAGIRVPSRSAADCRWRARFEHHVGALQQPVAALRVAPPSSRSSVTLRLLRFQMKKPASIWRVRVAARRLDLDHVGPLLGEQQRGQRPGYPLREID